jgi:hypothetical protein
MPIVRGRFRDDRFSLTKGLGNGPQVTVECGSCGKVDATGTVTMGGHKVQAIHAEQHFRASGWQIGATPKKTLCPECLKSPRSLGPPPPPPAPEPAPAAAAPPPLIKVEPPREPTVAERRRIADALEEHYNVDAGLYRQSWSDTSLAAKLNLPRAWITDIRTLLFGRGEANEAGALKMAAIERLEVRLREVTEEVMTRLVSVETELAKLRSGT